MAKPIKTEQPASYRVNDRRGQSYGYASSARANILHDGGTQTSDRKALTLLDRDFHRNITEYGRRILMTAGRWLYANSPAVAAMVEDQATLSTEGMQPQFYGKDRTWGDAAESALFEWGKICDVAGWPYDFQEFSRLTAIGMIRDGDTGVVLVENDDGYPMLQTIECHRVGARASESVAVGGDYDGMPVCDGVIHDEIRRPVAYRVTDGDGNWIDDISTRDMMLTFKPQYSSQLRGVSELACSVLPMQDLQESRMFELLAQKAASAMALIETNESGTADTAKSVIKKVVTRDTTSQQKTASMVEKLEGGTIRYFKGNTGSKLEAFSYDRPGANVMAYQETALRDVFAAMGWSHFFTLDPSKVGGASMRVIVERLNRTVRRRQRYLAKVARRVHGYAVAKLMKIGLLPWSDEWWMWEYQFPAEVTADRRYDSDVDVQEVNARFTTRGRVCAKRGAYAEDVEDEWIREEKRFQDKAKAAGLDLQIAVAERTSEAFSTPVQAPAGDEKSEEQKPNEDETLEEEKRKEEDADK